MAEALQGANINVDSKGEFDFQARLEGIAKRKCEGITLSASALRVNKLFSALASEYKSIVKIEKNVNLPTETADMLMKEVEKFISSKLSTINAQNCISMRKYYHHNKNKSAMVIRHKAIGEDMIALKEQKMAVLLALNEANKRLDKLVAAYADQERIDKARETVLSLEKTQAFILDQLKKLGQLDK